MSNKIVSIVIVSGGSRDYLKSCLDSIREQSLQPAEIIVIDNSLSPGFSQEFRKQYPVVKFHSSQQNLAYCQSLNKGIGLSTGDFVLCLNDDVTLDEGYLEKALSGFEIDRKIGMVSGKVFRSDAKTIDSTGLFLNIWRTAKERGYGEIDTGRFEREGFVFGVTGAVAFYRRFMLEDIKSGGEYFDQDFGFFYEDLDIAWRANNLGWKGYYIPAAIAYHVRGGTARKDKGINKKYARRYLSDGLLFDLTKNRYLVLVKNESFTGFLSRLPFIMVYDLASWAYLAFFRPKILKNTFRFVKFVKEAFKKRELMKIEFKLKK